MTNLGLSFGGDIRCKSMTVGLCITVFSNVRPYKERSQLVEHIERGCATCLTYSEFRMTKFIANIGAVSRGMNICCVCGF